MDSTGMYGLSLNPENRKGLLLKKKYSAAVYRRIISLLWKRACRCDRRHLRDWAVGGDFNQGGPGCKDQIFVGVGNKRR